MSRCFPYPPPGYSRNGATYEALIESIKLQKETDKATKSERKKEKRAKKEKKEKKEKRKDLEKSKLEKSQQDSHKQLQTSFNLKEQRKDPITIEQQLEKSDVTEEHGQPIDSHKPSYSSDSTQNSNKRKRDDLGLQDDSNQVKPIKIRLFKKQKAPNDSIKETSCSISGRIDQQQNLNVPLVQSTSSINGERTTPLVSSNSYRKTDRKQSVPVSLQSRKDDVALGHSSRQQPIPVPSYKRPSEQEIPTPSSIPSVSIKNDASKVSSSGRRSSSIDEIKVSVVNNEKKKEPISEIVPPKVGPTRFEKKMMKRHSKYEKLIGGWVPPAFEAAGFGDDDDWLKGSGKTKTARSLSASGDVAETCREMMWQPCARFLVEADVYALPYTVPF